LLCHSGCPLYINLLITVSVIVTFKITCLLSDEYQEGTVYVDPVSGAATFKAGVIDKHNGTAYGYYNNTLTKTGWGILELSAECATCKNTDVMFAAGFLEGVFTASYVC